MAEVVFSNVTKIYKGSAKAVSGVNLTINEGEFVVLVGPSGCGKTTLLRMLAGLEEVTEGDIYIGGKRVNDIPPKDRDIAMVFQNYALYPHMTIYENMAFGLKLRKYSKAVIEKRVQEASEILEIGHLLDRKPKTLSGGQRQRVAVGRAIVRNPNVFLFDEPLSNLDAKLRVQMRTEISKLHNRLKTTMVYVTHDQTEAMTMGDRIVILKDGIVQQVDTPLNVYNNPSNLFVAGFIGSPAMNFISGRIQNKKFVSSKGGLNLNLENKFGNKFKTGDTNEKYVLGIRPEDFCLDPSALNDGYDSLHTKIEIVETLGSENYIYFQIDGTQCLGRISAREDIKENQNIELLINREKVHLFDADSGEAIL